MITQRAEVGVSGELAAAFRAPNHTEPTSRHIVRKVVRIPTEDGGKTRRIQTIKIVDFKGRVPLLANPNPNA